MKRTWSFFDSATGVFIDRIFRGTEEHLVENTPDSCTAIEGIYNRQRQKVDTGTGEVIFWQAEAPADDEFTTWQWDEQQGWLPVATEAAIARDVRTRRARLLAACDWVVARAADTGEPIPEAWRAYRAALRDITAQPGFPTDIEWPVAPA